MPSAALINFPPEVTRLIGSYLDRSSAFALTLTCKGLRDAGEARLYEQVDLTTDHPTCAEYAVYGNDADDHRHSRAVSRRCDALVRALDVIPPRLAHMRELHIQPSGGGIGYDDLADRLYDVLIRCAPHLRGLSVTPPSYRGRRQDDFNDWRRYYEGYHFVQYVAQDAGTLLSFPYLTTVRLGLGESCLQLVPRFLASLQSGADTLRHLILDDAMCDWEWRSEPQVESLHLWQGHLGQFTRLRSLELQGDLSYYDQNLLTGIIQRAPNLEVVRMTSSGGDVDRTEALSVFAKSSKLRRMELPNYHIPPLSPKSLEEGAVRSWPPSVVHLEIPVSELVVHNMGATEMSELRCDLPYDVESASVQRMTIITDSRPSLLEYVDNGVRDGTGVYASGVEDTHAQQDFLLGRSSPFEFLDPMPQMTTVMVYSHPELGKYFGSHVSKLDSLRGKEHDFFVPPDRWEAEGHRGLILRQYRHPVHIRTSFYHQRALSRVYPVAGRHSYIGHQRHWRECARLGEFIVPGDVVDDVYQAAGLERAWITPGRNWSLNDAAWQVLQGWYYSVKPVRR